MRRPNILFAFADDWGRYASAYAAHHGRRSLSALIDTPHFDRVAGEGVLFTNGAGARAELHAVPELHPVGKLLLADRAVAPSCRARSGTVPSRRNPFLLRDAGYHIGFSYKVWSPGHAAGRSVRGHRNPLPGLREGLRPVLVPGHRVGRGGRRRGAGQAKTL